MTMDITTTMRSIFTILIIIYEALQAFYLIIVTSFIY